MAMHLYYPVGALEAADDDLAYLDYTTLNKYAGQVRQLAFNALQANPSAAAVVVTMEKGGVNAAAKLFARAGEAADEFHALNNSGAFDAGVIYLGRRGEGLGEGTMGPIPHSKPGIKWRSAAPWIILGAIGIAGTVYYTRQTIKRRRAAKGG